ncbi:MAG: hypothetical protein LQ349_007823 [Xanthoria aureola]|nr:MAG: hypothetical protein LQ349_007823 [Xanthoria aureola]
MATGTIKLTADQDLTRVDLQMRVLYNLMQQEDSTLSRSVALDSKKLAEASTRDSSSMKAVAVLTMVFLPSTAVAVSTQALHSAVYRVKSRVRILYPPPD